MSINSHLQDHMLRTVDSDARFVRDLASQDEFKGSSSVAIFSMFPFMSLFLYESRAAFSKLGTQTEAIDRATADVLTASRHSVKFFEDTARGIAGQRAIMRDDTIPAHRKVFLNNTWFPPARALETDLGLYLLDGTIFLTTHAMTYFTGLTPETIKSNEMGTMLYDTSVVYGQEFGKLADTQTPISKPGLLLQERGSERIRNKDVRSERVYGRLFNGETTPDLNATLTCQLALAQFLTRGINFSTDDAHAYTRMKMKFVVAYQITNSLKKLLQDSIAELTPASQNHLAKICTTNDADSLLAHRKLRNLFVHYTPAWEVDDSLIDTDVLATTMRVADCECTQPKLEELLDRQLEVIRFQLVQWSSW